MPQHAQQHAQQPSQGTPAEVDPATLHLRVHPDDVLRTKATPVGAVTENVQDVARRMLEVMHEEEGIGLAAPQVGLPWRMFVCQVPTDPSPEPAPADHAQDTASKPLVCIDPMLTPGGPLEANEEGCLSLPDIRGDVNRPTLVTMEATGLDGKRFTIHAAGLLARCIQHETDHLDGVLIIDKFGQLDRLRTRSAVRRLERKAR